VGTEAVGGGGIELAEVTYPDCEGWVCPTSLCPGVGCGPVGACGGIVQPAIGWYGALGGAAARRRASNSGGTKAAVGGDCGSGYAPAERGVAAGGVAAAGVADGGGGSGALGVGAGRGATGGAGGRGSGAAAAGGTDPVPAASEISSV
jgi:hypothetical protein